MEHMKSLIMLLVFLLNGLGLVAQNHTEKIVRELSFARKSAANVLKVENIDGFVHVEPYNGDKVLFEVERIIRPKAANGLEKAKELSVEFKVSGDSIISYLKAPYIQSHRTNTKGNRGINIDRELEYGFTHNYTIKVPQHTNLSLITINNGDIKIRNISTDYIEASNINGAILLENIAAEVDAKTINGNVVVSYRENPKKQARLETLNGNIELLYQKALSATIDFSSFNGDFYTDLEDLQKLSPKVEKVSSSDGSSTTYRLGQAASFKTGAGAARLELKTFNGKVIVKARG
ncbi:DUF4097 family beta strand repeat-containing protein [Pontibacter litorisediminis]|uniref:DUF4097 family beta strand repeat-containing protein n=1 Tax=Pontibacter litorisediminis TaxID=1846260 RepID=UPI0023EC9E17|nr:DUF4097 family beta strand repeat-containing protein [Pontibacter litorisediminis]